VAATATKIPTTAAILVTAPAPRIPPVPATENTTGTSTENYETYTWGNGYGGEEPVVLDLAGNGINIAKLTSSNTFQDMTGSGFKNRTAWAGAGNAVLFFDPNDTNAITQANQIVFTDWDPTASTDMQALLDVFDTDHDGKLDAGDVNFSKFKLMVTNAEGTQSVQTPGNLSMAADNAAHVKRNRDNTRIGRARIAQLLAA
jgi:hypothetical protein